jgi:acetoin utilization protein AcuB
MRLIKDIMTSPVKTVSPETTVPEAHHLMVDNGIRRLPVVIKDKLTGIVTLSDVLEARASDATSLNIWELNYLISKLTVKEIMTAPAISISQDASVKDAAVMLLNNKFGGIPVVDKDKVVGIITESDIFRLVAESW